ncbi:hypothetical protein OBBRIDRAFT_840419 [Obba rivulosa]|uniref:Uncharacterized protein n=1 Tax=Obba rivulosa TaxID=1052685 RepID=A0A8E2AFU1_9APHY|nr:hypothetical protein OBBRIDRAFT_840419 [Obba rivulosa]
MTGSEARNTVVTWNSKEDQAALKRAGKRSGVVNPAGRNDEPRTGSVLSSTKSGSIITTSVVSTAAAVSASAVAPTTPAVQSRASARATSPTTPVVRSMPTASEVSAIITMPTSSSVPPHTPIRSAEISVSKISMRPRTPDTPLPAEIMSSPQSEVTIPLCMPFEATRPPTSQIPSPSDSASPLRTPAESITSPAMPTIASAYQIMADLPRTPPTIGTANARSESNEQECVKMDTILLPVKTRGRGRAKAPERSDSREQDRANTGAMLSPVKTRGRGRAKAPAGQDVTGTNAAGTKRQPRVGRDKGPLQDEAAAVPMVEDSTRARKVVVALPVREHPARARKASARALQQDPLEARAAQ